MGSKPPSKPQPKPPKLERPPKAPPKKRPTIEVNIDPEQARRSALLQLHMGRAAHMYSILGALALATSSFIQLLLQPGRPLEDLPPTAKVFLPLLVPIVAGALIATAVISLKWEPYRRDRFSGHFIVSLWAFASAVLVLLTLIVQTLQLFPIDTTAWVYPGLFSGISLSLVSMGMTWDGWGRRKMLSIVAAILPMAIMAYAFTPFFSSGIPADLLILSLLGSAGSIHLSGAMLHIIASSTNVQEREVIRAGSDKILQIREDLKARSDALYYREDALREKEADIEAHERSMAERAAAMEQQRKSLEAFQAQFNKRQQELKELDKQILARKAEVDSKTEEITAKEQDINLQAQKSQKTLKEQAAQSQALVEREKEIKRLAIEAQAREKDWSQKAREMEEWEARLKGHDQEVSARLAELNRREMEIRAKEGVLASKMEARGLDPNAVAKDSKKYLDLQAWEKKIMEKEGVLSKLETELKGKDRTTQEVQSRLKSSEDRANSRAQEIKNKETQLLTREKALSDREATLGEKTKELQRQLQATEESLSSARDKEKKYVELSKEAHSKAASAATSQEEIKRLQLELQTREKRLAEMDAKLRRDQETTTGQTKKFLELQKDLEAKEQEIQLRTLEMDKRMKEAISGAAADSSKEQQRALEAYEKRLREKEQEIKNRLYQKEKELELREKALQQGMQREMTESAEVAVEEVRADKIKTGTPRLDDLLLGGLPMNSQLLLVGPAFVGKEVGIMNFLAEGLKKGIPVVIVTTSKPPTEIAKELGPILPTFIQYEQLGLVKWVDASGTTEKKTPIVDKSKYVVNGGADFIGILAALNMVDEEYKGRYPYYRLAFLTLSTCVTQGDEKESLAFVQKFVNRLRQTKAVALYAVERGMHSDQQIEALEHQVDGAIHFKVDRQKNLLMVQGLGEVQTRDWVEYKFTNRSLMIGSFMLERIR